MPIGQISQEAQKYGNMFMKKFRQVFSRKGTSTKNMEDVFRRLSITSYPLTSSSQKKKIRPSPEAIEKELSVEITNALALSTGELNYSDMEVYVIKSIFDKYNNLMNKLTS